MGTDQQVTETDGTDADSAPEPMWSPKQLAQRLGISVKTIYDWRYRNEGPPGYRIGRHVRYRREDVEAWLEECADSRVRG